jgi:hypothetical protein
MDAQKTVGKCHYESNGVTMFGSLHLTFFSQPRAPRRRPAQDWVMRE